MKTELMLLITTDGSPTMTVTQVAKILNVDPRTIQNKIYKKDIPFPMFKLGDSGGWSAHVSDVANYIDTQRESAAKEAIHG